MPKVVAENGNIFGWRIVFDDSQHLTVDRTPGISGKIALLSICPKKLADEVVSSIGEYTKDLQNSPALFDTFKEGFLSMALASRLKIPRYLK